jgi:putative oxidoreductase
VGGVMLLVGMVPLAVLVLAPVILNVVGFHLFVAPDGLPLAAVVTALELFLAWANRDAYRPLFVRSGSADPVATPGLQRVVGA